MKAVILARVSTLRQEKEGLSLKEIQLPQLRDYARDNGFEVDSEFVFSESADRKIRTKFNEMVNYVKNNPKIEAIIAYRVDRITRNYRDAVLIDDLRSEHHKEIHFVHDRLVISDKTIGRDITDWDTKVYLAKQYLNRLKEDAVTSAQSKLANFEWPVGAPYGYINKPNDNGKNWIEVEPNEAQVVLKIFEWYSTGSQSMLEVKNRVKEEFDVKMSKGQIDCILKKKFYFGIMVYDGKEYPHHYERIISEELFEKVQAVKAGYNKKHFKFAGLPFAYRGLIRCAECGCIITPERKMKKGGQIYFYYHCTQAKGKHDIERLTEKNLTDQFKNLFSNLQVPQDKVDDITNTLKSSHNDKKYFHDNLLERYQTDYNIYENRITKMYEDKLDGSITPNFYEEKRKEYRGKQKTINDKIAKLHTADEEYYLTAEYILKLASKASELFESSEPQEKRLLLKMTLQDLVLDGKYVRFKWIKPFDKIAYYASRQAWLRQLFKVSSTLF
jgi:DNA invertase Pin-like site-specific DNA recombinase